MTAPTLLTELSDHILTLRINRPDKRNALTQTMYGELAEALLTAADNPEVRVVLLTGTPDTFTAGNDLQDFLQIPGNLAEAPVGRFMAALSGFPKPVVAAVNGAAVGIGTTLLLHCDLVYVGETARLQMPFVSLGLCPEFTASYALPRIMGHVRAAELLMLGEAFSAQTAHELGLVNEVLPPAEVESRARQQALRLAQQAPQALLTTKMLMRRFSQRGMHESLAVELEHFSAALKGPEVKEAVSAFMQKRKPDFSKLA
ncbi:MAG TPA: enoyl-CoA hydratase [Fluviicoccus sp.]|nr:enoyl-CoA hydratase [Fluviicoccus sp.]